MTFTFNDELTGDILHYNNKFQCCWVTDTHTTSSPYDCSFKEFIISLIKNYKLKHG